MFSNNCGPSGKFSVSQSHLKNNTNLVLLFLLQTNGNPLEKIMGTLLSLLIANLMLEDDQIRAAKHLCFFPFQLL